MIRINPKKLKTPSAMLSAFSPPPRFDLAISAKRKDAEQAEESGEFYPDFRS